MSKLEVKKTNIHVWDWLSVILLIMIMQIAAARLVATLWTLDLSLVMVVTFLGTILGLALGKSVFNRFWVFVLASDLWVNPYSLAVGINPRSCN